MRKCTLKWNITLKIHSVDFLKVSFLKYDFIVERAIKFFNGKRTWMNKLAQMPVGLIYTISIL